MKPWLAVVGIGEDGLAGLSAAARALVETAEILVGGERHLAMVPIGAAERLVWQHPLTDTIGAIAARRGISHKTVRNHLAKIYRKLELHGRAEAVLWAARMGLTEA